MSVGAARSPRSAAPVGHGDVCGWAVSACCRLSFSASHFAFQCFCSHRVAEIQDFQRRRQFRHPAQQVRGQPQLQEPSRALQPRLETWKSWQVTRSRRGPSLDLIQNHLKYLNRAFGGGLPSSCTSESLFLEKSSCTLSVRHGRSSYFSRHFGRLFGRSSMEDRRFSCRSSTWARLKGMSRDPNASGRKAPQAARSKRFRAASKTCLRGFKMF